MKRSQFGVAVVVSGALSAAAISTLYVGARVFDRAFAPFGVVDWLARAAPGTILTALIDGLVSTLQRLSVANLSGAAKASEETAGVGVVFVLLTLAGAGLYLWSPRRKTLALLVGGAVGVVAGTLLASVMMAAGVAAGPSDGVWTSLVLATWGALVGWTRVRLPSSSTGGTDVVRISRRHFLLALTCVAAAVTVLGTSVGFAIGGRRRTKAQAGAIEVWSSTHDLPNAEAAVQPAPGTRPELTPVDGHYRIDINTTAPRIDGSNWRLRFRGLVARPLELSLDELRRRDALHQFITLACISNPVAGSLIGTTRWSGVPLSRLLDEVEPRPPASHLRIRSADGFDEVVAIDLVRADPRIMLTYDWDGLSLAPEHGYPLRVYIPDRYGMKQPKWIQEIEAIEGWQPGYWVRRGWDREARMKATSVIDTMATNMMNVSGQPNTVVPIGGIAHAGARGISRVELSIDEAAWIPVELRDPLSHTTWVIWRYNWPFHAGTHRFTVRCFDGDGRLQIATVSPPHPDGATGLHTRTITL
jgi:DMSO/TMAO reductase YedYZ molybdopterin-dependent catalytic subunit